jgi:hypothetical protein
MGSRRPGIPVDYVDVVDHIAEDQHAVALAPDATAGHVEHGEAGHLIALAELQVDIAAGPHHG